MPRHTNRTAAQLMSVVSVIILVWCIHISISPMISQQDTITYADRQQCQDRQATDDYMMRMDIKMDGDGVVSVDNLPFHLQAMVCIYGHDPQMGNFFMQIVKWDTGKIKHHSQIFPKTDTGNTMYVSVGSILKESEYTAGVYYLRIATYKDLPDTTEKFDNKGSEYVSIAAQHTSMEQHLFSIQDTSDVTSVATAETSHTSVATAETSHTSVATAETSHIIITDVSGAVTDFFYATIASPLYDIFATIASPLYDIFATIGFPSDMSGTEIMWHFTTYWVTVVIISPIIAAIVALIASKIHWMRLNG